MKKTGKISFREIAFNILGFSIGVLIMSFFPSLLLFPVSMLLCKIICIFAKSKALDWGCILLGIAYIVACWVITISELVNESGAVGLVGILGLFPETLIMVFATSFAANPNN